MTSSNGDGERPGPAAPGPRRSGSPTDRRVRRTRQALQRAFVDLVLERGYAGLTIDDITERADVSRATFYAHYADKSWLLATIVDELWAEVSFAAATAMPLREARLTGGGLGVLFRHAAENVDAYRVILSGADDGRPLRDITDRIARFMHATLHERGQHLGLTERLPLDFLARLDAADIVATLIWWLEEPDRMAWDDLAAAFLQRMAHGDAWAAGFEPGDLVVDEVAVRAAFRRDG